MPNFWDDYEKDQAEVQSMFDRALSGDEKSDAVTEGTVFNVVAIHERETGFGERYLVEVEWDEDETRFIIFEIGSVFSRDRLLARMMRALNGRTESLPIRLRQEGRMILVERGDVETHPTL